MHAVIHALIRWLTLKYFYSNMSCMGSNETTLHQSEWVPKLQTTLVVWQTYNVYNRYTNLCNNFRYIIMKIRIILL